MQPISVTYADGASGAQTALSLDWRIVPFSVSYQVVKVTGAGTMSVQMEGTLDSVQDANAVWFSIGSALTATTVASLTAPIQGIRANFGSLSSTDCVLKILQGESIN